MQQITQRRHIPHLGATFPTNVFVTLPSFIRLIEGTTSELLRLRLHKTQSP
jgi:hypothetical protein